MSLVTPWLKAEPTRYALMHGDYRLDNMLFDPDRTRITVVDWQTVGIGLPGKGPRVLHRDEPGSRRPVRDRAGPRRPVPSCATGLRHNGLRLRHLLARLPPRRGAGAAAHRSRLRVRRIHRARRRDDADHVAPGLPGDPRAGNARADQVLPSELTQADRVVDAWTPWSRPSGSGGRFTITTATPSAAAASSFGRVIVAAAVLRHQSVDAMLAQQAPARRRSGTARATARVRGDAARSAGPAR